MPEFSDEFREWWEGRAGNDPGAGSDEHGDAPPEIVEMSEAFEAGRVFKSKRKPTHYVCLVLPDLAHVKVAEFFIAQGGMRDDWGLPWRPVNADSIEHAKEKAMRGEFVGPMVGRERGVGVPSHFRHLERRMSGDAESGEMEKTL